MDSRFRRDIYIKSLFAGNPNKDNWNPKTLYIKSDWDPDPQLVAGELRAISSLFLRCLKTAFLPNNKRSYSSVNLDPVQRYTLNILEKSSKHVVIPADKNLGPVIIERDQYILSVLSLLRDQRTYQQLTKEEACSAIYVLHKLLRTFIWMDPS